jgi:hypothetical protein
MMFWVSHASAMWPSSRHEELQAAQPCINDIVSRPSSYLHGHRLGKVSRGMGAAQEQEGGKLRDLSSSIRRHATPAALIRYTLCQLASQPGSNAA